MTSAESKPYAYTFLVTFTDAVSGKIIHDETVHLIITGSWFYLGRVLGVPSTDTDKIAQSIVSWLKDLLNDHQVHNRQKLGSKLFDKLKCDHILIECVNITKVPVSSTDSAFQWYKSQDKKVLSELIHLYS